MSISLPPDASLLDHLDAAIPQPLAQFDAFPKLPTTYRARSSRGGLLTILIAAVACILTLNDISEYLWGWTDYEFSVDQGKDPFMAVNIDMTVAMPCKFLSVDLRDAVGDRLYLSGGIRRDGTTFDHGQATLFKEHADTLTARQAIKQARTSRGLFGGLFSSKNKSGYKPTYNHTPDANACRVFGTLWVKKVTANLHITTSGHGYASHEHTDHSMMNLSHVISEFSFGPYFPDMTQPLDYSYELTDEPFISYQYFMHIVPTSYIQRGVHPLNTHQYSVTHYTRPLTHGSGTPGIFFKFDIDPLSLSIIERTSSFSQFIIRLIGVLGGVFVCMGYAVRITAKAAAVVTGEDDTSGIVAAESSGAKVGLRQKWGGGHLRARPGSGRMIRQGSGWVLEADAGTPSYTPGAGSPYTPSYAGTPQSGGFASPGSYMGSPNIALHSPGGAGVSAFGPPPRTPSYNAGNVGSPGPYGVASPNASNNRNSAQYTPSHSQTGFPTGATLGSPMPQHSAPGTPMYGHFPPSPNPGTGGLGANGFPRSPAPGQGFGHGLGFGAPGSPGPGSPGPPRRMASNGSAVSGKKDD